MKRASCAAAGAMLTACALLCAVLLIAVQTGPFEKALLDTVDALPQAGLSAFASHTMGYLRGEIPAWQPDVPFEISPAFAGHMAEVRGWVSAAPWIVGGGIALSLALLWLGGFGRRAALWGMLIVLGLLLAVLLWAAVDFASFWMLIHEWFIPGGIFSAAEPVMRLFPLELFFAYVAPVAVSAVLHVGALAFVFWKYLKKERS